MLNYPQQPERTSRDVYQQKTGLGGFISPQRRTELHCFQEVDAAGDQIKQIRPDSERHILACFIYICESRSETLQKTKQTAGKRRDEGRGRRMGEKSAQFRAYICVKNLKNNKKIRIPLFLHSPFYYLHTLCNLDFSSTTETKPVQYWKSILPSHNRKSLTAFTSPKESCLS